MPSDITGQKRNHGVALVPSAGRGFITDGTDASVTVFDLKLTQCSGRSRLLRMPTGLSTTLPVARSRSSAGRPGTYPIRQIAAGGLAAIEAPSAIEMEGRPMPEPQKTTGLHLIGGIASGRL
jgi:hypothetical protein